MKNILVITWWEFDDALIQSYTLPYLRIIRNILREGKGGNVYLLTLEKNISEESDTVLEEGIVLLKRRYFPLSLKGMIAWRKRINALSKWCKEKNITHLHSWCAMPGGIAWYLKKKTGLPHIADSFEPHADPMVETGTWKKNSFSYKLLMRWEKAYSKSADVLIANSPLMQQYAGSAYNLDRKIDYVKPACVDLSLFSIEKKNDPALKKELGLEEKKVLVYAGKFGGLYYRKETFALFRTFYNKWKDELRILLLTAEKPENIKAFADEFGIPSGTFIVRFVPHKEMPAYLGLGHIALCPIIPTPSRVACSPIKNGEYWAMGLPLLVCKGVSIDDTLVNKYNAGYVLERMDEQAFSSAVSKTEELLNEGTDVLYQRIRHIAVEHRNFATAENIYRKIYGTHAG